METWCYVVSQLVNFLHDCCRFWGRSERIFTSGRLPKIQHSDSWRGTFRLKLTVSIFFSSVFLCYIFNMLPFVSLWLMCGNTENSDYDWVFMAAQEYDFFRHHHEEFLTGKTSYYITVQFWCFMAPNPQLCKLTHREFLGLDNLYKRHITVLTFNRFGLVSWGWQVHGITMHANVSCVLYLPLSTRLRLGNARKPNGRFSALFRLGSGYYKHMAGSNWTSHGRIGDVPWAFILTGSCFIMCSDVVLEIRCADVGFIFSWLLFWL